MSINPIVQDVLKVFVLAGHSRADGWGQGDLLFTQHADLVPRNGADVRVNADTAYWKDVYVATSAQDFPGASHTPTISLVGNVQWLELTTANVRANGDKHPHPHPYNYPNNRGSCYPRYFYNAWKPTGFDGFHYGYGKVISHNYDAEFAGPFVAGETITYGKLVSFNYDTEVGGPFVVGETLTFAAPVATGVLMALTDLGVTGTMTVAMVAGAATLLDNATITGGTSAATAAINGAVTTLCEETVGRLITLTDLGATGTVRVEINQDDNLPIDNCRFSGGTSGANAFVNGAVTQEASKHRGTLCGLEIPFANYWRNHWSGLEGDGVQVGFVKMAFSSTLLLPAETGADPVPWLDPNLGGNTPASAQSGGLAVPSSVSTTTASGAFNNYWTPAAQFDWSPATSRIYKLWYDKMVGAALALPAGKVMDVQCIIPWFGDNDSLSRSRFTLESAFKKAIVGIVAAMRRACAQNNWTSLAENEIPVIMPTIGLGYGSAVAATQGLNSVTFCNGVLREIAADDPFMRVVDGSGWTQLSGEPEEPPIGMGTGTTHESHTGYIQAAADIWAAYLDIVEQSFDAISVNDRMTLDQLKTDCKRRYDRGGVTTDVRDDVLVSYINQSIRSIVSQCGDSCWWLNRRIQMSLTFDSTGVASMPLHVARVLYIEDPNNPKRNVTFQQIGFGDGGRCQIALTESWAGVQGSTTFIVHHIGWPSDVTENSQLVPIPRQISEWVVAEVCKRLASGSTDMAKVALISGELAELKDRFMRTIGAQHRAEKVAMRTPPRRRTLGYGKN